MVKAAKKKAARKATARKSAEPKALAPPKADVALDHEGKVVLVPKAG